MDQNYRKSGLCRGYDLGVSCVACCIPICTQLKGLELHIIEPESYLRKKELVELGIMPPHQQLFQKGFAAYWDMLCRCAEKNTSDFNRRLAEGVRAKCIERDSNLLGFTKGAMGCLLYNYDDEEQGFFYRPKICRQFLCQMASESTNGTRFLANRKRIFSEFIMQNTGSGRLNSLSYSRIMHLLNNRPAVLDFFGIRLDDGSIDENVAGLNRLLDIVSQ